MNAIIMAGGRGSRIASISGDVPKPMMDVCGKPILERQIENLVANGIKDITIVTGHLGHIIKEYFGTGKEWNADITYFEEDAEHPLGTAGALFCMNAEGTLTEDFILMCADLVCDIDFVRLVSFHNEKKAMGALATLLIHPNSHPYDSALIETQELLDEIGGVPRDTGKVIAWLGRDRDGTKVQNGRDVIYHRNRVNAGIQVISKTLIDITAQRMHIAFEKASTSIAASLTVDRRCNVAIDLDRDVLRPMVASGMIYALNTTEYICDMGTPDRYKRVIDDVRNGQVARRNLRNKQYAIFLDRDGTLNKDIPFINNAEKLELLPDADEAVLMINKAGYLAVVITNQSVIARGEATWENLRQIHNKLETLLGESGAYLDGIYVCPHHSDKGFEGERIEYKRECSCRKPKTGLIEEAAMDMNIDVSKSIMIGDTRSDEECGRNAGCMKSIRLHSGYTLLDAVKDVIGSAEN